MEDNTTQSGKRLQKPKQPFDKNHPYHPDYTGDNPRGIANNAMALGLQKPAPPIPVVTKGQKYVAPPGRHSQQTHRRAEERAADATVGWGEASGTVNVTTNERPE